MSRSERFAETGWFDLGLMSGEEREELAQPYLLACLRCSAQTGDPCRHLTSSDKTVRWAHRDRLYSGLRSQGFQVEPRRQRCGPSQILVRKRPATGDQ